jgi:hypothetical protein
MIRYPTQTYLEVFLLLKQGFFVKSEESKNLIIGFSKILELFLFVHEFTPLSSQK